jgi:hypothetical protein
VPAPGQAKTVAMLSSLDYVTRQIIVHTRPSLRSSRLYGPEPLPSDKRVVLVEENGHSRWRRHRSRSMATIEWLPKYAPGLNDSEAVWSDLRIISPLVHSTAQSNRRWTRSNHERMALPLATHEYLPR